MDWLAAWKLDAPTSASNYHLQASSLEITLKQRNDDCQHLKEELETANADHRAALAAMRKEAAEGEESLAESQAAVKLLMATVKERDAAMAKLEAQAAEMQGSLEGARRGREEMGRAMQVGKPPCVSGSRM